jgi:hypothetical protein
MELKYKCIGECKRNFGVGDWECAPGIMHTVEPKTFYILDAPTLDANDKEGKAFRNARTSIENCPPERTVKDASTGELTKVPGGNVQFTRGVAVLDNPEKIYWLDKHGHGRNTESEWRRVYFSPLEKQQLREIEIGNREREVNRKLNEVNDLMEIAKSQTKSSART